jgi:hypothetical protein
MRFGSTDERATGPAEASFRNSEKDCLRDRTEEIALLVN